MTPAPDSSVELDAHRIRQIAVAAYADSPESRRALKLRPSVTLVRSFLLTDWWEIRLGWASQIQYQILSVLLLFTPLGLLLAVLLSPETPK